MKNSTLLLFILLISIEGFGQCFDEIVSLYKPVTASSTASGNPANVVDDNINSQWVAEATDTQWVSIDLGITHHVCGAVLQWGEGAFATDFELQYSDDNEQWETALSYTDNMIAELFIDELDLDNRYFRVYATSRFDDEEGYAIREITLFGTLDAPYQILSFDPLSDRLSTDGPVELFATATSGLPASFEVVSGPATVNGNELSLTGEGGTVVVRALQNGNDEYNPAEPVERSFEVINPADVFPEAIITSPAELYPLVMPAIGQILVGVKGDIIRREWFSIEGASLAIDGNPLDIMRGKDDHFYAYWTPPGYGTYTISAEVFGSNGNSSTIEMSFELTDQTDDVTVRTFDHTEVIAFVNPTVTQHFQMPSNLSAFNSIVATLDIGCPGIGCDDWDRLAHIDVRNPQGEWIEIIRYITPYGEECSHSIDVSEYRSLLQGNPEMRVRIGTFQRGWAVTLDLDYQAGTPEYQYSRVEKLWYGYHPFGDPLNLQPAATYDVDFGEEVDKARLYLVGTGHGWGENNTDNAAEFFEATHDIYVNGNATFQHHNWYDCDPNPDGCQPQGGTWWFDRAGWCPGAISSFFEYDLDPYLGAGPVELWYKMEASYVDLCHPNNPTCIDGLTCPNCDAGFNPHLVMATNLVTYSHDPIGANVISDTESVLIDSQNNTSFNVFPNPSTGLFTIIQQAHSPYVRYLIYNAQGQLIQDLGRQTALPGRQINFDISTQSKGIYYLVAQTGKTYETLLIMKE
jgi:hypothetical protein